ncbi:MAG: phosphoglucomutase [Bacteroidetes bacterium RIFOXYA12_FULL_35_11]|nr:MAG: phosphoglucomutase [Bacteroidetes bacterium GWF2_35_48]OFY75610.1 MAG: phosphoglucomutase [Bacteroidetes bacterium RIFOXYA12_FULL_35_11]OFY95382.1 MAG: phosphoglucomutase [Bacteroidetes bacterium RIFOXYC12_FULL_35_7]HBX52069.1 phosphoglucomutase [Bacteroidales bacterium]
MNNTDIFKKVKEKAQQWLHGTYDEETKKQVHHLLENDEQGLVEAFYQNLEFGTGGLRGIMGVGTNRMNIYTVAMATQGLCNYIKKQFTNTDIKVAVAYDSRNNSKLFAETTANVFSANGIKVYLFDELRPTPELSFAIRHFGCKSGVVVTASHNPKEYNGYKTYWNDGGQIIAPHDKNIIEEVQKITSPDEVKMIGNKDLIEIIGDEFDTIYLAKIKELSLSPEIIQRHKDLKIVYTPLHGTGVKLVPEILKLYGFTNIITVPEQMISDGNFPTVKSPNPEVSAALAMAIAKANETGADLVMATDPDADRVGIAVRNNKGEFILLNGNQTGAVLFNYIVSKWSENGKLQGKEFIVKTIVTTELLVDIANKYKIEYYDVLTGFKYIADIILQNEGKKQFICGGEESYGYLAGDFVRDKDAIIACALIAEMAAVAKDKRKSVFELLLDIYVEYGFYKEYLVNVEKHGKSGAEEIQKMMNDYRNNPPVEIMGSKVVRIADYQLRKEFDKVKETEKNIDLPKSNVLQFFLEDGTKISIRPSGTEPKIKFYFGLKENLASRDHYEQIKNKLDSKFEKLIHTLNLK